VQIEQRLDLPEASSQRSIGPMPRAERLGWVQAAAPETEARGGRNCAFERCATALFRAAFRPRPAEGQAGRLAREV
jgi:hypothetical protein